MVPDDTQAGDLSAGNGSVSRAKMQASAVSLPSVAVPGPVMPGYASDWTASALAERLPGGADLAGLSFPDQPAVVRWWLVLMNPDLLTTPLLAAGPEVGLPGLGTAPGRSRRCCSEPAAGGRTLRSGRWRTR